MRRIELTQNRATLVDDEDYEYLNQWKWFANKRGNRWYAGRKVTIGKKKQKMIHLHRVVNNTPDGMETDHINGDGLDNRKENLRDCKHSDNLANISKTKKNSSGFKGVVIRKNNKGDYKYYAGIGSRKTGKYKRVHLGAFSNIEEAALAYNIAATKSFGKFAQLNEVL